jgi:hypothetical protein
VLSLLVLYYGVIDSPMLAPAVEDDLSRLAPAPPVVRAGPGGTFNLADGVTLEGGAVDEQVDAAALTAAWSVRQGPAADGRSPTSTRSTRRRPSRRRAPTCSGSPSATAACPATPTSR